MKRLLALMALMLLKPALADIRISNKPVSPGGSNGQVQFNTSGSFDGSPYLTFTEGDSDSATHFTVKHTSNSLSWISQPSSPSATELRATEAILSMAPGTAGYPASVGTDLNLFFSASYGNIAKALAPPRDVYSYQLAVTPYGVIVEPAKREGFPTLISVNREPDAPFQVGYGTRDPSPSSAKALVSYPGDSSIVVIDSTTANQFYAGVISTYTVAGSTSSGTHFHLQAAGKDALVVGAGSHLSSRGASPSAGTCGTSPSVTGTDNAGTITVGTNAGAVTACTLTFANTWNSSPACAFSVSVATTTIAATSLTATAATLGFGSDLGGRKVYYVCLGND